MSDSVAEKLVSTYIEDLWDGFNGEHTTGRKMYFERYVRSLFSKSEVIVKANFLSKSTHKRAFPITLGGCTDIKQVDDLYTSVRQGDENVIYYSRSLMEELVDFMYKRDGTYYAIQVTDSSKHDSAKDAFASMKKDLGLGDSEKVFVVYTVPEGKFPEFRSNPVQPVEVGKDHQLQVFLAEIRNPADKPYESNVTLAGVYKGYEYDSYFENIPSLKKFLDSRKVSYPHKGKKETLTVKAKEALKTEILASEENMTAYLESTGYQHVGKACLESEEKDLVAYLKCNSLDAIADALASNIDSEASLLAKVVKALIDIRADGKSGDSI